ncbi:hypothetical protein FDECE_3153 [Fusarium decemcellulare]|nr:hypothetical protein FDECE_3153 [Fusarium decemcellulare]
MTICKFFQQGNCKFGNNCRFEHPNSNNRNQPSNRFGALGGGGGAGNQNPGDKYSITAEAIERDLTSETPQWILSAYAPGRDAPEQLFGGYPREQSFEELRLHFMTGKASGNEQQALNEAQALYANAQQQMQHAARNPKEAVQFIVGAENQHPNRLDICKQGTQGAPFGEFLVGKRPKSTIADTAAPSNPFGSNNTSSPFGGGAPAGQSAFGQPSALGAKPSPFGAPSFGQPSQPSGFGQPSQPAPGGSAFGQPSQPAPAFGQPSQPASAFGQPSALGAKPNPFGTPAFGQPSQPNAPGSAFGQTSQLGQKPNPFGAPSNANNTSSPFGSGGANNNAPAPNAFGAPSGGFANNQNASPFASSNNNQASAAPSAFAQPSQGASPFGQPSAPAATNAFASANQSNQNANNPFGQPSQPPQQQPNGFASQNNQQQPSNPFGQPSKPNPFGQQPPNPAANPFSTGQPQKPAAAAASASSGPYPPNSSKQHPPVESYSSKGMDGRLSMFKGKPVIYNKDGKPGIREFDGTWRRIWFPDGPPGYSQDTELPSEKYDDRSKAQWMAFSQTANFQDGLMPEQPPPRECTLWDF